MLACEAEDFAGMETGGSRAPRAHRINIDAAVEENVSDRVEWRESGARHPGMVFAHAIFLQPSRQACLVVGRIRAVRFGGFTRGRREGGAPTAFAGFFFFFQREQHCATWYARFDVTRAGRKLEYLAGIERIREADQGLGRRSRASVTAASGAGWVPGSFTGAVIVPGAAGVGVAAGSGAWLDGQ